MSQPDLTPDTSERLLTLDQVAEILGVTPRMVRELRAKNLIPYVKVGTGRFKDRLVRFRRSDIDAYIEENLVDPRKVV